MRENYTEVSAHEMQALLTAQKERVRRLAQRSKAHSWESLLIILIEIGIAVIEKDAEEIEIKVREARVDDGIVNYLDQAILNWDRKIEEWNKQQ